MSDYQFHPLRDYPHQGILHDLSAKTTHKAEFLSPQKAKALARARKEELATLEQLRREIRYASDLA